MTTITKLPPHNEDAENATLGGILIDPDALSDVLTFLSPKDFYIASNRAVFKAILALNDENTPIDFITVNDQIKRDKKFPEGLTSYLVGLMNEVPTSINTNGYGRIVKELSTRRRLIAFASQVVNLSYNTEKPIEEILAEVNKGVVDATSNGADSKTAIPMSECTSNYLDFFDKKYRGDGNGFIKTGYIDLDNVIGGLPPEYIIWAGESGMGKSATTCVNLPIKLSEQGKVGYIFSVEMADTQIIERMACCISGIDYKKVRLNADQLYDHELPLFMDAIGKISRFPIYINFSPVLSVAEIRATLFRHIQQHGPVDYVVIDHFHRLSYPKGVQETTAQQMNSNSLAALQKEIGCPFIVAAQLRKADYGDARPDKKRIRGATAITDDARLIIGNYIPPDELGTKGNTMEWIILKQNEGEEEVTVGMYWDGSKQRISNLAKREMKLNGHNGYR